MAQALKSVKVLLSEDDGISITWKSLDLEVLTRIYQDKSLLFKCNPSDRILKLIFMEALLQNITMCNKYIQPSLSTENTPLWYNKSLHKPRRRSNDMFVEAWYERGILCIRDIVRGNTLMSREEISDVYDLPNIPRSVYRRVVSQIPDTMLVDIDLEGDTLNDVVEYLKYSDSKVFYRQCVMKVKTKPERVIKKWEDELHWDFEEWSEILVCNYKLTHETKVKTFLFKLFHRVLPTQEFLFKVGISETDVCRLCHEEIETLLHYFCFCPVVTIFWTELFQWLREQTGETIPFESHVILFGYNEILDQRISGTNYIILLAKYYLYLCKHKSLYPLFEEYRVMLKEHYNIELKINTKNNHLKQHKLMWSFEPE